MFTVTRALEEALLQHFMYQKLEISYAIYKPFPFFEGLRDKSFITESTYRESLEACSNLVPVSRVVYNILTKLEKTFNLPFLELLFSQINLREYPNLMKIFKSFRSVVSSYEGWNRNTPILLEVPANPVERSSCGTLLPLLPLQRPNLGTRPQHPTPAARVSELRASPQHSTRVLAEPSRPAGPAKAFSSSIQKGRTIPEEDSQQMPSTPLTTVQVSSDNVTSQTKGKEDVRDVPRAPSAHGAVVRNDAPEPNDPEEPQEAPSTLANKKGKKRKRIVQSAPRKRQQNKSLPQGTTSPAHGTQEKLQVVNQATPMKNDSTRVSKIVTRAQKAKTECAQTSGPEEISGDTSKMKEGKEPREPPSTLLKIMQDHLANERKRSLGKSGEKQNTRKKYSWSSSKRKQKKKLPRGTTSPAHGTQEKLQVVNQATQMKNDSTRFSKIVTRAQKAKTECAQTSGPEENKKEKDVRSSSTRTRQKTIPQEKTNKAETVDFLSPELPVTCGEAKGILYMEKIGKGSSAKCIQNEEGVWLTPREFEIEGKGANSSHWKRNVLCRGQSIEKLMKKGLLLCPPRINLKREWENADECEVCCKGGSLLCCDTCPRAFHEDCHIPPAQADRSPWSCTFCRMEESPGSQDCHRGSEVLERQMRPEQQLKCEFLLLKAYCHPQSSFFAETPLNIRDYAEPFREAMWLDLVKERLTEKIYTVAWFVRDMRLIFRNHKTFYKASDLGQVGLDLEATFEKDLKELLSFHDAGEKSSRAAL